MQAKGDREGSDHDRPRDGAADCAARGATRRAALPASKDSIVKVARHFGGIQIDPTRTVERTQYLVLWSRLGNFDRALLEELVRGEEVDRMGGVHRPGRAPAGAHRTGNLGREWAEWQQRGRDWIETNKEFRQSILDQLRAEGPLQSRQIDDSKVKDGWDSTGWTHGKNTSRMLDFMSVKMDVVVTGRSGQERLWNLTERVIPGRSAT